MTSASTNAVNVLEWHQRDHWHTRTTDGRFSVCRMNVCDHIWFIAFRFKGKRSTKSVELGATRLPITASDAERTKAIRQMQELCEATP